MTQHYSLKMKMMFQHIDEFGLFSGLKLNKDKTIGLWVGKLKTTKLEILHNVKFTNTYVKALGVYFGNDKCQCNILNWEDRISHCQSMINSWNKRKLTLFGKILIIKSMLLPKITYILQNLYKPKNTLEQLNTLLFKFLWKGKNDKIKRNTVIGHHLHGGLEMLDIDLFYKTLTLKWIKNLQNNYKANWKLIPLFFLNHYGQKLLIFNMNLDSLRSLKAPKFKLPLFYKSLIELWIKLNNTKQTNHRSLDTFPEIRKQIIWGNQFIKYKGKCLNNTSWIESNILFMNDILSNNGEIKADDILQKLKHKQNWIAEFHTLKYSIPTKWKKHLKSNDSIQTTVKTALKFSIDHKELNNMTNKDIYNYLLKNKLSFHIYIVIGNNYLAKIYCGENFIIS